MFRSGGLHVRSCHLPCALLLVAVVLFAAPDARADGRVVVVRGQAGEVAAGAVVERLVEGRSERLVVDAAGRIVVPRMDTWIVGRVTHRGIVHHVASLARGGVLRLGEGRALRGVVRTRAGAPVAHARVRLSAVGTRTYLRLHVPEGWGPGATTDAQGRYALCGLGPSLDAVVKSGVWVAATAVLGDRKQYGVSSHGADRTAFTSPTHCDIEVSPTCEFTLRVVEAHTGQPVGGMQVSLDADRWPGRQGETDGEGLLRLADVPTHAPRRVWLRHKDPQVGHDIELRARELERPGAAAPARQRLQLLWRAPVLVQGRVLDAYAGRPALVPLDLAVRTRDAPRRRMGAEHGAHLGQRRGLGPPLMQKGALPCGCPLGAYRLPSRAPTAPSASPTSRRGHSTSIRKGQNRWRCAFSDAPACYSRSGPG